MTVNQTLSCDMEPIINALTHGPPSRIAKTILKCKTLRTEIICQVLRIISSEMNQLCSKKNPSVLRKTNKDDLINVDMKKWKGRAPVIYTFLLTCCSSKNKLVSWHCNHGFSKTMQESHECKYQCSWNSIKIE